MKTFIAGFPYVRERYFATFRDASICDDVIFLLPRVWTAKKGSVRFIPPLDERVATTPAFFHHSHALLIGGLFKGWMPLFPWHLWRHRHDVSLVYSCSEPTLLTTLYQAVWSKIMCKKHICFTWENIPYEQKLRPTSLIVHRWIMKLVLLVSDGLICGNNAGKSIHQRYTNIPMEVIPMNGVDVDYFQQPATSERKFRGHDFSRSFVITFIGALGKRKGIDVALDAFAALCRRVPECVFVLAGTGEYESALVERIEQLKLSHRVVRFPWLDDSGVRDLLSTTDVFVYPSIEYGGWAEQFGYSMTEAMSMNVPVISTTTGSISDIITHNQTGLLVPPHDSTALLGVLEKLHNDAEFSSRIGNDARQAVIARYSHSVIARAMKSFFNAVQRKA